MKPLTDPLVSLPEHVLDHITGERRRRLVEYLARWGAPAAAERYVRHWLELQPQLATLREALARLLIDDRRAAEALDLLDTLDAERGMSESRRQLRIQALAALDRWEDAYALLPDRPDDPTTWRLRADLLRRQGRFEAAATAYARAADLLPDGAGPLRGLAELALAQAEPAQARALLLQRQTRQPDVPPDTRDLLLLRAAAEQLDDTATLAQIDQQLQERRRCEQASLYDALGFAPLVEDASARDQRIDISQPPEAPTQSITPEPELSEQALAVLHQHFGYQTLRPGQAAVIDGVLQGKSILAVLPTGAGKSLTYQLPALLLPGATLVISPLIALMKDQLDNLPPALAACATTINSTLESSEVGTRLRGVAEGRYRLVYVAPERLRQQPFIQALRRAGVARVVVDEAHCVSLWGVSFRPDYLFIQQALEALGGPPVLALTATATPETEAEIKYHLGDMQTIRTSVFRSNLRFEVRHVANKQDKANAVVALCREIDGPVVVYVRSRDGCEEVAGRLRAEGIAAEHYHAQIADRAGTQDRFMRDETRVLVATVAFGMGVDKPDIRAIIHYNLPPSVEAYYQEAGRAGRDGVQARCVLLYAPADKGQMTAWLREDALSKDDLRRVYGWLRRYVRGVWGLVSPDEMRRALHEEDETRLRVGLGLLERVGLLSRHFDLPRAASVTLREGMFGDQALWSFAQALGLQPGLAYDLDLLESADRLGWTPNELERQLLAWHAQGWVRYQAAARDMLLELRPAPTEVGTRLDQLLGEYATRQDERIDAIAAYARSINCRHRMLAAHFGERLAPCGDVCDMCAPSERRATRNERPRRVASGRRLANISRPGSEFSAAQHAILDAAHELAGQLNDKELACVLLGVPGYPECAASGRLAEATIAQTRQEIAALVAAGHLAYRNRALIPVVARGVPTAQDIDGTILRCLAHLPFPVGRSGLAKILKGAAGSAVGPERCPEHAALGQMTVAAIEHAIAGLIERGYLARRENGMRPLLALSEQGAALLAE